MAIDLILIDIDIHVTQINLCREEVQNANILLDALCFHTTKSCQRILARYVNLTEPAKQKKRHEHHHGGRHRPSCQIWQTRFVQTKTTLTVLRYAYIAMYIP